MRYLPFLFCLLLGFSNLLYGNETDTKIQLASVYQGNEDISNYLVSEKFDGVRAIWDGSQLRTRGGHLIKAPDWFTQGLPDTWLDGELWAGYNNFAFVSAIARRHAPNNEHWRQVTYYVFDAPSSTEIFAKRHERYLSLLSHTELLHIKPVKQLSFGSVEELNDYYHSVLKRGGEGVILHAKNAKHEDGRTTNVLKYKPYLDDEAIVIKHLPGKGKYQGMMGSLLVKNAQGKEFKVGSGFSDEERASPPPIGSQITYRYQGYTKFGKPRFARFLRVRPKL
ncbi:DNA ligase [Pseudoalteromonas galatheae]|uniref:DNA ligase n=1 Tax=Pseudoalteromonas galatheae TaxID=579562 RepID=UPI0030CFF5D6